MASAFSGAVIFRGSIIRSQTFNLPLPSQSFLSGLHLQPSALLRPQPPPWATPWPQLLSGWGAVGSFAPVPSSQNVPLPVAESWGGQGQGARTQQQPPSLAPESRLRSRCPGRVGPGRRNRKLRPPPHSLSQPSPPAQPEPEKPPPLLTAQFLSTLPTPDPASRLHFPCHPGSRVQSLSPDLPVATSHSPPTAGGSLFWCRSDGLVPLIKTLQEF